MFLKRKVVLSLLVLSLHGIDTNYNYIGPFNNTSPANWSDSSNWAATAGPSSDFPSFKTDRTNIPSSYDEKLIFLSINGEAACENFGYNLPNGASITLNLGFNDLNLYPYNPVTSLTGLYFSATTNPPSVESQVIFKGNGNIYFYESGSITCYLPPVASPVIGSFLKFYDCNILQSPITSGISLDIISNNQSSILFGPNVKLGNDLNSLNFLGGGSITLVNATAAADTGSINISCQLLKIDGVNFANNAQSVNLQSGIFETDIFSRLGPTNLNLSGGVFNNNGNCIASFNGGLASFSAGNVQGQGNLCFLSDATVSINMNQGNIYIGSNDQRANVSNSNFSFNSNINANLFISQPSSLQGYGLILGDVNNLGSINAEHLIIGASSASTGAMSFGVNAITSSGTISASVGVDMYDGNLSINSSIFADSTPYLNLAGGVINIDSASILGPVPINPQGGMITNNGIFIAGRSGSPGSSTFNSTLAGSGQTYLLYDVILNTASTQSNMYVGEDNKGQLSGATLTINGQFGGNLTILSNSQLITGYGGVSNVPQILNSGTVFLGYLSSGSTTNATTYYQGNVQGTGNIFISSTGTFLGNVLQNSINLGSATGINCPIEVDGLFSGLFINQKTSYVTGTGQITGPLLQNFGNINPSDLALSTSYITGALDINSMPVTSTGGTIGLEATSISFYNGSLSQQNSSFLGFGADQFYLNLGNISSDASSYIGPSVFTLNGGQILNNGILVIGDFINGSYSTSSNSSLQGVNLIGSGTTYAAGNVNILKNTSFVQSTLNIAQALNGSLAEIETPSNVSLNVLATTSVINGTLGILNGQGGYIEGTTTNFGLINPTYASVGTSSVIPLNLSFTENYPLNNFGIVAPTSQMAVFGGNVINQINGAFGKSTPLISVYGGYIELQQDSDFAEDAGVINVTGGTINVTGNANGIGYHAQNLAISGGVIDANPSTNIGPCPLNFSGGTIFNDGITALGLLTNGSPSYAKSTISGGNFINTGALYNASDLNITSDCILGSVTNGIIFDSLTGSASYPGTISVNASVSAVINNFEQGVISGNNGFLSGTINNYGGGINPQNLIFNSTPTKNYLTLNFLDFTNTFNAKLGWGSQNIRVVTGSIFNENSDLGGNNTSQSINISGGYLQNDGRLATTLGGSLFLEGGTLSNTAYGTVGAIQFVMTGGVLNNDGHFTIKQNGSNFSKFSVGTVQGTGTLNITGLTYVQNEITQGNVFVQYGLSEDSLHVLAHDNLIGSLNQSTLVNNGIINATVNIGNQGLLYGTGVIVGNTEIQGELSVGPQYGQYGTMDFKGNLVLDGGSQTDFWMGSNYNISHLVVDGDLTVQNGPVTLFIEKQTRVQYVGEHTFTDFITTSGALPPISDFTIKSYYDAFLLPGTNPQSYDLAVIFSSLKPNEFPGNAGVVANDLVGKNGYGSLDMQEYIDAILRMNYETQEEVLLELCPQFKLIQYSLEKLMFTQEDYYARKLNDFSKGFKPFFDIGFNQYAQKGYNDPGYGFNSYHVNSWTQNLGFTYGSDHGNLLIGVGAIESYFTFLNYPARARYNTAIAELGFLGKHNGFEAGIDFLASYTQIKSRRNITYFDLVAKNKHNAWNASSTLDFGYKIALKHFNFKPYDKVGYIFGHESHDKETGAGVLNLDMNTEKLSLLRNTLGLNSDYSSRYFKTFIDLSYVYEAIFSPLRYKGSFTGTPGVMDFYATFQNHNFLKVASGLTFQKDGFELDLSYQALMSKKFLEQSAQISFSKKF